VLPPIIASTASGIDVDVDVHVESVTDDVIMAEPDMQNAGKSRVKRLHGVQYFSSSSDTEFEDVVSDAVPKKQRGRPSKAANAVSFLMKTKPLDKTRHKQSKVVADHTGVDNGDDNSVRTQKTLSNAETQTEISCGVIQSCDASTLRQM